MEAGSLWEMGEERVGEGIPKEAGAGRKRKTFCNNAQFAQGGGNY